MKKMTTLFAVATAFICSTTQAAEFEVVAKFDGTRPGNVTVTEQGRTFLSMQPLDGPEFRVVELLKDGSTVPFPTVDWADGPAKGEVGLSSVIGIDSTADGVVWILDMGSADAAAQIVAWDTVNNKLFKRIEISKDAVVANSFLQDFVIDTQRQQIYIADTSLGNLYGEPAPAFVVVDLASGKARRVLQSNKALLSPKHDVIIDDSLLAAKREDGSAVYRIAAAALANDKLTDKELANKIEFYSEKCPSDGMIIDKNNNIYVGDVERNAIGIIGQDGYKVFAQDDTLLSWADGFSIQGGYLYVTQNSLHLNPALNAGEEGAANHFTCYASS